MVGGGQRGTDDDDVLRHATLIHLKVAKRTPLCNGSLECRLFEFPLLAGGHAPGHAGAYSPGERGGRLS